MRAPVPAWALHPPSSPSRRKQRRRKVSLDLPTLESFWMAREIKSLAAQQMKGPAWLSDPRRSGPGTARWHGALPLTGSSRSSRQHHSNVKIQMEPLAGQGWSRGVEGDFWKANQNYLESSMDLKKHQMHFFVVLFYCKMQPPSMTGNWKLPSPSRPCPESREIKAR